jgi:hypothetical protein
MCRNGLLRCRPAWMVFLHLRAAGGIRFRANGRTGAYSGLYSAEGHVAWRRIGSGKRRALHLEGTAGSQKATPRLWAAKGFRQAVGNLTPERTFKEQEGINGGALCIASS